MTIHPGTRLGPYEIVAPIGAGGMGEVFKARDTRLERSVAIKVLSSHLSSSPQLRERFDREARAVSALNHPNICTLYDVGHQDGVDYIVMELLDGETLADRLSKGALPLQQVLRYGVQIAGALDKAHRHGILHRDLKPGNIMLTKSGAKLLDFGLAKSTAPLSALTDTTNLPTEHKPLTQEGTILGTFQYMAPEQLEGEEADARTDIFALGAVLYEMATGRKAFEGRNKTSLIAAIVGGQPRPVKELQPLAPFALEHVITRCLEKDPENRWQSAHDIATELEWSGEIAQAGVMERRTRTTPGWIAFGVLLLLSAAVIAALLLRRSESTPRVIRSFLIAPEGKRFSFELNDAGALSLSPDGRFVTFVTDEAPRVLHLRALSEEMARPLAGTAWASYPFWSPDSRWIGFFADGKLKKIDVSGGPAVTICSAPEGRGATWGRDGTILFEPHWRDPIHRVSATGGTSAAVTKLDPAASETTHRWPWMLPDGKHFLYLAGSHLVDAASELNAIYAGSVGSSERKLILRARSNVVYSDGYLLFVRDRFLMAQPFDDEKLELTGEPVRLAENIFYVPGFFRSPFAASHEGPLVYYSGASDMRSQLSWLGRDGKDLGTIGEPEEYRNVRLSPDGTRLSAEIGDPIDLWMIDLKRGTKSRLTRGKVSEEDHVVWSPDGKSVVYGDSRAIVSAIYIKSIDSSREETLVYKSQFFNFPTDWSEDGRFVAFDMVDPKTIDTPSGGDVWILPMFGERKPFPFVASEFGETGATFSPDGRWIAYQSNESGRNEIYVARFPGGDEKRQISTAGAAGARWVNRGNELLFVAEDGALLSVKRTGDEFGVPTQLLPADPVTRVADVFPDGSRFVVARRISGQKNDPITLITGWRALLPKP